jgi:hypothetical protein
MARVLLLITDILVFVALADAVKGCRHCSLHVVMLLTSDLRNWRKRLTVAQSIGSR